MSETSNYCLVECISELNVNIKRPLQQTLRIKFSTFDVSANYLIFGATSGGIYIFSRTTYEFLKLVPTKEGSIVKLAICPEERFVSVATTKGAVIIVENCFNDSQIRYQMFGEHEGNLVTALIWHGNEIYCGDNKGKVSVILLASTLPKTIFQTPSATLMHLDSTITQLDAYDKFILVSTRTKTFLCDTEEEQYRQIGKKLRDGDFGACFLYENERPLSRSHKEKEKNRFKVLKDDEHFDLTQNVERKAKIFCSRPGFRLWECDFEASVACTYQFKSTLHETQSECLCIENNNANAHLKTRKISAIQNFENFACLKALLNKFLITFSNNNLVIFDVQGNNHNNVLFIYEMRDIKEVKIYQNTIYVWNKKDLRVVALMDLEVLVLKLLMSKQYTLCSELCVKYHEKVLEALETSDRLHPLTLLREKLSRNVFEAQLERIFNKIRENKDKNTEKLNGIVKVNNGHLKDDSLLIGDIVNNPSVNNPSCSYANGIVEPLTDRNYINNILYKQFQVNLMYNNIDTKQLFDLLESQKNLDEIVRIFDEFIEHVVELGVELDNNRVQRWCYEQYLKYLSKKSHCLFLKDIAIDSKALKYIFDGFKSINSVDKSDSHCKFCSFPLPLSETQRNIEYGEIGRQLYLKCTKDERNVLKNCVPSMWIHDLDEFSDPLPLLIQLSDIKVFKVKSVTFTNEDNWEDCLKLLIKLKQKKCLNCDNMINFDRRTFTWKDFSLVMLSRLGGLRTVNLLKKFHKFIPNEQLGYEFYRSCLFGSVFKQQSQSQSCDFLTQIVGNNSRLENEFEYGLRQYLSHKYLDTNDDNLGDKDDKSVDNKGVCSVCSLFIENPVLDVNSKLSCGHVFHTLCLRSIGGICSICMHNTHL